MKRIVAMLLTLAMVFALCACGKKQSNGSPSDDEKSESIGFSAEKIEPKEENMDDVISVEAVKIEHGSTYYAKIRNNYNSTDGDYPNRIMLQFQLLDKQGDVIETSYLIYESLGFGQGGWAGISCGTNYSQVGTIRFIGYTFQFNTNNINDPSTIYGMKMKGGGNFTTPIDFSIDDVEIVS